MPLAVKRAAAVVRKWPLEWPCGGKSRLVSLLLKTPLYEGAASCDSSLRTDPLSKYI